MTEVRFVKNPAFERELQRDPEFIAFMHRTTDAVRDEAIRIAPKETGYYSRHIKTLPGDEYIVYTDDIAGHLIEWGSRNNEIYSPLRNGVRAAGLRLEEILK